MKKFGYMFIGAFFTLILSIGFLTFADSSVETSVDNGMIEDIANVQNDSTFFVGSKLGEEQIHLVEESPVLVTNVSTTETKPEIKSLEEITLVNEEIIIATGASLLEELEKLEIKIESNQTEIKLKQERKKKEVKSEVEIEWENEKVKLKDQKAENFIEEMFATIEIEDTQDLPLLAEQLLEEFQMNPHAVEIEIKAEKLDGTKYTFEVDN